MSATVAATILVVLAIAHSVAGELLLVRPLVGNPGWTLGVPRQLADRILRFTWHAVPVAWLGLAAALLGVPVGVAVGAVALVTGTAMAIFLRGHFAWSLFLVAGLYALDSSDALPRNVLFGIVAVGVAVAAGGALLHLLWALGSKALSAHTFPEDPETLKPLANPGRIACLGPAGAAATLAALLVAVAWFSPPVWVWWVTAVALLVALVRVVGDFKHVGFFKTVGSTPFALADTRLYTPLFVSLAAGAGAALTLAGSPLSRG